MPRTADVEAVAAARLPWRVAAMVRFAVAGTIAAYVVTYQGPPGAEVPAHVGTIGLLVALDLLVLAAIQSLSRRPPDRAMSAVYLLADLASPIAILYLFAFDPREHLFVLLFVTMAQGALVLRLGGALGAWAVSSFAYALLELNALEARGVAAVPLVVALRILIMLFIAIVIAQLTTRFEKGLIARRKVERSLAYQARLLENVNDAVLATDLKLRITAWNRAAELTYGWKAEEVLGRQMQDVLKSRLVAQGPERDVRAFARTAAWSGEFVQLRKSGEPVYVEAKGLPLHDENGSTIGYVTVNREVADRRRAQEASLRADQFEQANLAKNEFLSRMSHELRTPLNAVLGFAQLLSMDDMEMEQRVNVQEIMRGGQHLLTLIDDVLEISRVESNGIELHLEPVSLAGVVAESAHMVAFLADGRSVTIENLDMPDLGVLADRHRLKQVLLNLLSNAIKYNREEGRVWVTANRTRFGYVRIEVHDTGRGIPADATKRLFVPFERLGAELTEVEGTGLGLALSKNLVEAMGGRIGFEALSERGSTFWVELPETEPPSAVEEAPDEPDGRVVSFGAGTLLYVEDDLANLRLVESVLKRRPGVRLVPAMQGRLGLELAGEVQPDLILLDVHLPDIPGDEVLRKLREHPKTRDIPVVAISADATEVQRRRMLAAGAVDYLAKPIDIVQFLTIVDEVSRAQVRHDKDAKTITRTGD